MSPAETIGMLFTWGIIFAGCVAFTHVASNVYYDIKYGRRG